jgi:hypothetical protein
MRKSALLAPGTSASMPIFPVHYHPNHPNKAIKVKNNNQFV